MLKILIVLGGSQKCVINEYSHENACPAMKIDCNKCHTVGHFAKCCKSKSTFTKRNHVNEVQKEKVQSYNRDDYLFMTCKCNKKDRSMVCHAGVNCEDKLLHFHEMLHAARATYSFLTDKSDVWPTCGLFFCRHNTDERRISAPSNQWLWLWVGKTHQLWMAIYEREGENSEYKTWVDGTY